MFQIRKLTVLLLACAALLPVAGRAADKPIKITATITMVADLARKDRFNVPGTAADSNWSRRLHMTVERLGNSRGVKQRMKLVRQLLQQSGRL